MIPLLLFPIDITSFLRALFSNFRPDSPGTNIHVYSSRVGRGSGRVRARSCDHVSSRRNVQNPRDGGHADIPENAHPRGTANPTKCAQGETLRNCRVYRSWTSTRAIPPSLLLPSLFSSFSLQMKSRYRCTKPGWIVRRKCGWFLSRFRHRWNTSSFKIGFNFLFEFNDARNYTSYL